MDDLVSLLNIKVRAPSSTLAIKIAPEANFGDVLSTIATAFNVPPTSFSIVGGFPPAVISLDSTASIAGTIANNETLRLVPVHGISASENDSSNKKKRTSTSSSTGSSSGKGKTKMSAVDKSVAAAKKAAERAGKAIAEAKTKNASPSKSFGAIVATLHGDTVKTSTSLSSSSSSSSRKKTTKPQAVPQRKRKTQMGMSSEDDISTQLLSAVSEGGTDKKNRFLRAVFRRAVEYQYDQSKAEARVASLTSRAYSFELSTNNRILGSGMEQLSASATMNVTFAKGMGQRTNYVEQVDCLDEIKLKAVIGFILASARDNKDALESLKPVNMAGCSPRVFWSLVRLYGPDIRQSLEKLFPTSQGNNWSWLDDRKRILSDKAQSNRDQEMEEIEQKQNQNQKQKRARKRVNESGSDSAISHTTSSNISSLPPSATSQGDDLFTLLKDISTNIYSLCDVVIHKSMAHHTSSALVLLRLFYQLSSLNINSQTDISKSNTTTKRKSQSTNKNKREMEAESKEETIHWDPVRLLCNVAANPEQSIAMNIIKNKLCNNCCGNSIEGEGDEGNWAVYVEAARALIISCFWHGILKLMLQGPVLGTNSHTDTNNTSKHDTAQSSYIPSISTTQFHALQSTLIRKKQSQPRFLAAWHSNPSSLIALLGQHPEASTCGSVSSTSSLTLSQQPSSSLLQCPSLSIEGVTYAIQLCRRIRRIAPTWVDGMAEEAAFELHNWTDVTSNINSVENKEVDNEYLHVDMSQEWSTLLKEGWQVDPCSHISYIGQRVVANLEDSHEDAVVIAYLAPDDDEPEALYKIEFQEGERCDLDESELQIAIKAYTAKYSQPLEN